MVLMKLLTYFFTSNCILGISNYTKKIIEKMEFIANVYNLVIYIDEHKKALVDITSLLMMYACGKYGMDEIYS